MKNSVNLALAIVALAVLGVSVPLLIGVRGEALDSIERNVDNAVASFRAEEILHGPGGDTLVRFEQIERVVATVANTLVQKVIVTKRVAPEIDAAGELPLSPFLLAARSGGNWQPLVAGWRREPLVASPGGEPWGYLYLQLDDSVARTTTWIIAAVALAFVLSLGLLLVRIFSQQTRITKTTIELNERRRELIRLERLAMGGQLAAGLLHDLRKPVLHVRHSLDDLETALGDFAQASPPLREMRQQTGLFFHMLQDSPLEKFVKSDKALAEYVDLAQIVDQSLSLVKYEQRGVEVQRRIEGGLAPVMAPPFRLVQLFSNLIMNAYQAMNGRGALEIEASQDGNIGVLVSLTDSGPGIAPETIARIFEPFFTTKDESEGTGLGLSICRLIVEDLGGRISVDSKPGGPTTFNVWLPTDGRDTHFE